MFPDLLQEDLLATNDLFIEYFNSFLALPVSVLIIKTMHLTHTLTHPSPHPHQHTHAYT